MRVVALLSALVAASVLTGCQVLAPSAADRVFVQNDTTTPIQVHVNGGWVGTIDAGATATIPILGHGGPPFRIDARSRSGNVLFEMEISADDYQAVREGQASMSTGGAPGCGWIEARYGEPDAGVAEAPVGRAAPGGVCP